MGFFILVFCIVVSFPMLLANKTLSSMFVPVATVLFGLLSIIIGFGLIEVLSELNEVVYPLLIAAGYALIVFVNFAWIRLIRKAGLKIVQVGTVGQLAYYFFSSALLGLVAGAISVLAVFLNYEINAPPEGAFLAGIEIIIILPAAVLLCTFLYTILQARSNSSDQEGVKNKVKEKQHIDSAQDRVDEKSKKQIKQDNHSAVVLQNVKQEQNVFHDSETSIDLRGFLILGLLFFIPIGGYVLLDQRGDQYFRRECQDVLEIVGERVITKKLNFDDRVIKAEVSFGNAQFMEEIHRGNPGFSCHGFSEGITLTLRENDTSFFEIPVSVLLRENLYYHELKISQNYWNTSLPSEVADNVSSEMIADSIAKDVNGFFGTNGVLLLWLDRFDIWYETTESDRGLANPSISTSSGEMIDLTVKKRVVNSTSSGEMIDDITYSLSDFGSPVAISLDNGQSWNNFLVVSEDFRRLDYEMDSDDFLDIEYDQEARILRFLQKCSESELGDGTDCPKSFDFLLNEDGHFVFLNMEKAL